MKIFEDKKRAIGLIHKVYLAQLKTSRVHKASTKTKSEVRGGGRKPWKQKGTGQARSGSIRSPLWVGGGVIFGPKPHIVNKKINKKERQLAILSALQLKKHQLTILNDIEEKALSGKGKTKTIVDLLSKRSITKHNKILIITAEHKKGLWLITRNLKNVQITTALCLNLQHLLSCDVIMLSISSYKLINKINGKKFPAFGALF